MIGLTLRSDLILGMEAFATYPVCFWFLKYFDLDSWRRKSITYEGQIGRSSKV